MVNSAITLLTLHDHGLGSRGAGRWSRRSALACGDGVLLGPALDICRMLSLMPCLVSCCAPRRFLLPASSPSAMFLLGPLEWRMPVTRTCPPGGACCAGRPP